MQRTKSRTLEIDGGKTLDIVISEVRPLDLLELHKEIQKEGLPIGEYERLLPLCCNLTKEQIIKLYPSELALLIEDFKEVNSSFFAPWPTIKKLIDKVGMTEWALDLLDKSGMMEKLKTAISLDLQKLSVSSTDTATLPPSDTDGGTSPPPLPSPKSSPPKKGTSSSPEDSQLH